MESYKIFNPKIFDQYFELNPTAGKDLVKKLISLFLDKIDPQFEQLNLAAKAEQKTEIAFLSHQLKSLGANVGSAQISQICQQIESQINKENFSISQIKTLCLELEKIIPIVKKTLLEYKNNLN